MHALHMYLLAMCWILMLLLLLLLLPKCQLDCFICTFIVTIVNNNNNKEAQTKLFKLFTVFILIVAHTHTEFCLFLFVRIDVCVWCMSLYVFAAEINIIFIRRHHRISVFLFAVCSFWCNCCCRYLRKIQNVKKNLQIEGESKSRYYELFWYIKDEDG